MARGREWKLELKICIAIQRVLVEEWMSWLESSDIIDQEQNIKFNDNDSQLPKFVVGG